MGNKNIVVSIVSHGHGVMAQRLVEQLAIYSAATITRVVVTQNIPEDSFPEPVGGWPFALELRRNDWPKGFGENHNHALQNAQEAFVCVLNPDVELLPNKDPFAALLKAVDSKEVACTYPLQLDEHGVIQESERELPTPWALWRRRAFKKKQRRVDWVNAAFILIPADKWRAVGGFDTSYFMYCEDVNLSLRLQLQGGRLVRANAEVIHNGQRASSRQWSHLRWHIRSLVRLWTSRVFWSYMLRRKN